MPEQELSRRQAPPPLPAARRQSATPGGTAPKSLSSRMAGVPPSASFAFVMATGIVAIAAASQGWRWVGIGLFGINLAAFAGLSLLMLRRLIGDRAQLVAELSQHRTAAGFLTIIAAAAVLGDEFAVQVGERPASTGLWLAACGLWVGLVYAMPTILATNPKKPSLAQGLDGTWLLLAVATEALAVLATHAAGSFARPEIVRWLSLSWFLLGGFFYLVIITLILYRWLFQELPPDELTPPYWINMGAMAIATLAGARLESIAGTDVLLTKVLPGIAAATLLCWTVATWWIPLLVVMMIWRYWICGVPLSYRSDCWSMVFPLGMYTAATAALVQQNSLDFLAWIPPVFVWAAIGAWLVTFIAMVHAAITRLTRMANHTRKRD